MIVVVQYWCLSFIGFLISDLSPWRYRNRCFDCIVMTDSEISEFVNSNQVATASTGKIHQDRFRPIPLLNYDLTVVSVGVDIPEVLGCHLLHFWLFSDVHKSYFKDKYLIHPQSDWFYLMAQTQVWYNYWQLKALLKMMKNAFYFTFNL